MDYTSTDLETEVSLNRYLLTKQQTEIIGTLWYFLIIVFSSDRNLSAVIQFLFSLPTTVQHYEVEVHTGNNWAAATDAPVYLTLYGKRGDSGKRILYHSQDLDQDDLKEQRFNKFRNRQVDRFRLEAVSLGELQRAVIGHSGTGHGAGWFLNKLVVYELDGNDDNEDTKRKYEFPCMRWLDDHHDDGKTMRELRAMGENEKILC